MSVDDQIDQLHTPRAWIQRNIWIWLASQRETLQDTGKIKHNCARVVYVINGSQSKFLLISIYHACWHLTINNTNARKYTETEERIVGLLEWVSLPEI